MNEKKNILIVDDIADNLTVLSELLLAEGYVVRPVTSGSLALKTIAAEKPALILLDIKMPEMDGYAMCRRLKLDEKLKDIPVIFISAYGEESEKIKAFEAGGVDYIIKPFHSGEIYARVKTHLALADVRRELEQLNYDLERKVFQRTRELEESNAQLKKSEEKFSKAFQLNPAIMLITTLSDKKIIDANKAFEDKWGYTAKEAISRTSRELGLWEEEEKWEQIHEQLSADLSQREIELTFITKNNEKRAGLFSFEVIEFGNELCVLTVGEDITERKQSEDKIKDQLHELQRWYSVTLNREDRVMELKKEINELLKRLNEPPRYSKT